MSWHVDRNVLTISSLGQDVQHTFAFGCVIIDVWNVQLRRRSIDPLPRARPGVSPIGGATVGRHLLRVLPEKLAD
jgi:hypothetical protein